MALIRVDRGKCRGHALCVKVCPAGVFELDEDNISVPANVGECTECCSCVVSCPEEAIWVDVCE
ncbi:MAG: 4Fe-4S dicluster domain-containing protein [Archaeoglobaceae archaeon]